MFIVNILHGTWPDTLSNAKLPKAIDTIYDYI